MDWATRELVVYVLPACGYLAVIADRPPISASGSGATIRVISSSLKPSASLTSLLIAKLDRPIPRIIGLIASAYGGPYEDEEFEDVTSSLNFDTADCHIVGGCDLYTTKAARSDRKLYNHIEQSLEAQYESILRLSASLSPPNAHEAAETLNLSRSSPFGPLSEHSSRRTFAYLIATLNASHSDYDFSHVLRPTDFRRERHPKRVMNTINSTLYNLRPRESIDLSPSSPATLSGSYNSSTPAWGPRMWRIMDEHMSLKECSVYSYSPEEDPADADDGAIWSLHYFWFNPLRKRVCYLYLRAIPILSHTPPEDSEMAMTPTGKRTFDDGYLTPDLSSSKRARYWLGSRAESSLRHEDSDDDDINQPSHPVIDDEDQFMLSDEEIRSRSHSKGMVRAMSEEIADAMEV